MTARADALRVLVVDHVRENARRLRQSLEAEPTVVDARTAVDPLDAIHQLQVRPCDAVFLDIAMPGLGGLELGALLSRLVDPPVIVFVTEHDEHAIDAFGIGAVDYLLKPVRSQRLASALSKVQRMVRGTAPTTADSATPGADPSVLAVVADQRTRFVQRCDVRFVEAHGDYVRLHTATGRHRVRMPISKLESHWKQAHFLRVHRSYLVDLRSVRELRTDSAGALLATTDVGDVPVSRRHARQLRESLLHAARLGLLRETS